MEQTADQAEIKEALRARIAELVAALSQEELIEVTKFVERIYHGEVNHTAETAPMDDEPETADERAAVWQARDSLARGEVGISHEDFRRELGL